MALTIVDEPFNWVVRGQKIMLIASSTEVAQQGFRYGLNITVDAKTYTFYLSPAPDNNMYFDIAPLVDDLRNQQFHFGTSDTFDDTSKYALSAAITEWWLVGGVLTENEGSEVTMEGRIVINGYYQVYDGYKPNPEVGVDDIKYVLEVSFNYGMSDRKFGTHSWYLAPTWNAGNPTAQNIIWIPSYETDYGTLSIPGNSTYMFNNLVDNVRISLYKPTGVPLTETLSLNAYDIEALPVYPANMNAFTGAWTIKPNEVDNPGWRYYEVFARTGGTQSSVKYRFYNAAYYGQKDCHNDVIRLGWVNSRGGWDYFNFIKKSEMNDEIDRKKYRKVLFNNTTSVFSKDDRGLFERRNLVQQVLTVTSDYIQEGEFLFLRSLLVSNQVVWLTERNGENIALPVNLDDTTYTERKTRDGKLYNLSLKVRMANEYWT
jgi:hypothetical protein